MFQVLCKLQRDFLKPLETPLVTPLYPVCFAENFQIALLFGVAHYWEIGTGPTAMEWISTVRVTPNTVSTPCCSCVYNPNT